MHSRCCTFFLFLIFVSMQMTGQKHISLLVADAKNNVPIPFANVLFGNLQQGTMSDINGKFELQSDSVFTHIRISSLGYKTTIVQTVNLKNNQTIFLEPVNVELSQVDIFPGKNPALSIMEKVFENRNINNPDKAGDYSCIVYHKMAFFLDAPDSVETEDKAIKRMVEFNRNNHLFLIESVSEKKHMAPDKTNERLISGRVSGLEQPSLAMLPAQIQPFSFYLDYIRLLDTDFLNPVSQQGLKHYLFLLKDTLLTNVGDTLYYISFEPRKQSAIRGIKGSFHIHVPSYAIKTVNAETIEEQGPISLAIKQNYQMVDGNRWFPDQLESRLQINKTVTGQTFPFPLVGNGKSTVTAINMSPGFTKKDFSNIRFIDEASNRNAPSIELYRYEPLTDKDLATYHLIDSLGRKHRLDRMVNFQKNLIEGYLPIGYFKLDVKKIFDLNEYEGLKLGLGLWTGEKISENFSTGGYYSRSFKSEDNNYGAGLKIHLNKKMQREWDFYWDHCLKETGSFSFIDGYNVGSMERFKRHFIETMDPVSSVYTSFRTRFLQYFKTELSYQYNETKPVLIYPFYNENPSIQEAFNNHEYGLKLKWAHKETFIFSQFGLTSNGTNFPIVWTNFIIGNGIQGNESFSYQKYEAQFEKSFRPSSLVKTVLRVNAGTIEGSYPAAKLYSAFGSNRNGTGLETPFAFATMRPNEFAVSQFTSLFFRNTFLTRLNKPGSFKPEITLSSAFGIGDVKGHHQSEPIKTFNKGYYESGIYVGNLLRQLVFKYGFAVHYRYGPYKLPKAGDNWSFKIGLEIGL